MKRVHRIHSSAATTTAPFRVAEQASRASALVADNFKQVATRTLTLRAAADVQPLADVAAYLVDACMTVAALVATLPACAPALLRGPGAELPAALARVHDELLPHMSDLARTAPPSPQRDAVLRRVQSVRLAAARAAHLLVQHGLLGQAAGGVTADASAVGDALMQALMNLQVCSVRSATGVLGSLARVST